MVDLVNLSIVALAFFIAAASPGPATLAVCAVAMKSGRRAGVVFGFGLSIGLAFWGVVAATGLGAILQTSQVALTVLKLIGGAYLIWLAWLSARSATKPMEQMQRLQQTQNTFRSGLFLNISNPKAVLAWMSVLALGLGDGSEPLQVAVATFACSLLGLLIYAVYAFVFSTNRAMKLYHRLRRSIEAAVAILFTFAGVGLIRSALNR